MMMMIAVEYRDLLVTSADCSSWINTLDKLLLRLNIAQHACMDQRTVSIITSAAFIDTQSLLWYM